MKYNCFSILLLIVGACVDKPHAANDFSSQMADELVTRNNIYQCTDPSEEQIKEFDQVLEQYLKGEIDSMDFIEYENEIKSNIKDTCHCLFDLSEDFGLYMRNTGLVPETIESIRYTVQHRLPGEFSSQSEAVIQALTTPLDADSTFFRVDYIDFIPFEKKNNIIGTGLGIFSFSKPFFNREKNMAAIYYEYVCGGKCGSGNLSVFELIDGRWKLKNEFGFWEL
jgi:hypothetical protein